MFTWTACHDAEDHQFLARLAAMVSGKATCSRQTKATSTTYLALITDVTE